jgi:hypothetical protein
MGKWAFLIAFILSFGAIEAGPYFCSDPHRGGDYLQGFIRLGVAPDGRLLSGPAGELSEWDWNVVPRHFREAATHNPGDMGT